MTARRIAFLSSTNPHDKRSWSGTHSYMLQSLQKHCGTVVTLGPVDLGWRATLVRFAARIGRAFTGKRYSVSHCPWLSKEYGKVFSKKLSQLNCDVIFAPASSTEMIHVRTEKPIVYYSDTTFENMIDYYPNYSGLSDLSKRHGREIERMAIERATIALFASRWGADSAIRHFGASPDKVFVVPMGANIDEVPKRERILARAQGSRCRLLFLGVEWYRKGGDIALEVCNILQRRGLETQLTICGCIPPIPISQSNVRVIPFLNKNIEADRKQFVDLLYSSDFLLLPSRAECTAIAFCEASAFGLPSITRDTGGISSAVTNGVNGILLPAQSTPADFASAIENLFRDRSSYREMIKSCRAAFEQRLNWDAWGQKINMLLDEHLCFSKGR